MNEIQVDNLSTMLNQSEPHEVHEEVYNNSNGAVVTEAIIETVQ